MTTFIQHIYNRTTCNYSAFWQLGTTAKLLYLMMHSKLLSFSVSKPEEMRGGQNPLGRQRHIRDSTQNLLLRSPCSCQRPWPPKDYNRFPETLSPKMLFSKCSVSLIWIYIYSQPQTNMWDAFQAVTVSLKIMLLSHEFLHKVMSISGVALQVRIWTVQFYCFTVNFIMEGNKKTVIQIKERG
jgi:hypothetical protein